MSTWLDQPLSENVLERWAGRVASRTNSIHATLIRACREVIRLRADLRLAERVASARARVVVPKGYAVRKVDHEIDHQEYAPRWELWVWDADAAPITVAHVGADRRLCASGDISEPFAALRALMWAAEHDQCPPHEDDEQGGSHG